MIVNRPQDKEEGEEEIKTEYKLLHSQFNRTEYLFIIRMTVNDQQNSQKYSVFLFI